MAEFVANPTCKVRFNVYTNKDGNIIQEDEQIAGKKTFTFSGFASSITADELVNTENSPAIHNGVAAIMWLFTGRDDNFEPVVEKITTDVVDYD